MKYRKGYIVSLFFICILLNIAGKAFASCLELPVWLDSLGTAIAAYSCGPFFGLLVGAAASIIGNLSQPVYMVYGFTGIAVGVIIGICSKKKFLENLYGILTTGFLVALSSVAISTPFNYLFFDGYTGNKWGDGVIDLLGKYNISDAVRYVTGQYYVEFVDKVLTLIILYVIIRCFRRLKRNNKATAGFFRIMSFMLIVFSAGFTMPCADRVYADEVDYGTYMQVVYDNENGLLGGTANDIAQTKDGVLWIGTYGGLYRYSGREFELMNEFSSIKNVNCFYVDEHDRLWIGTNDNGLSIYEDGEIKAVIDEDSGLSSNSVRCMTMDENGNCYVGTTGSLEILRDNGELKVEGTIPEIVYAKSISADGKGHVAVVTDEGILYLLSGMDVIAKETSQNDKESFTCCVFSESGSLYAGTTGNNITKYKVLADSLKKEADISSGDISYMKSLCFSETGEMVVCADNGAGYMDNKEIFHEINTNNFNSSIEHMIFDYQGNLWFTSSRLGILKLYRSSFTEIYKKVGIEENVVNAITGWQGNYYFGTDSGLDMVNKTLTESIENTLTKSLEDVRIRCLMSDSRDMLWICTSGLGVWRVSAKGEITVYDSSSGTLGDKFRSAIELKDGTIVLAGDLGLTYIKNGTVTHTLGYEDGLKNPKVLCMLETKDGELYAGTDGNGIAVINKGKITKVIQKPEGLSSGIILRMVNDPENEGIFIVTSNSLCFMDNNGEIRVLDHFPYSNNYDVISGPDGKLFISGSAGIYVVYRDNLLSDDKLEYELLDSQKGLRTSLTVNSWNYVDENDNLYLAGGSGVMMVNMNGYDVKYNEYKMNLKWVQIDDKVHFVKEGEAVNVKRGATRIILSTEIVNYSSNNPHVSLYLEGFDESPRIMPLNEVSETVYTNLPVGEYSFHVAVLAEDGKIISENVYEIIKESEIYDGKWFLFYVGFVFVLTMVYLVWMIFRTQFQRTLNIQKRELELAKKQIETVNEAIVTIAGTVDAKDPSTSRHSYRVSEYSVLLAKRMGFSDEKCEELRRTALLHDIGKIGIPDDVLNKPSNLTEEEYDLMKSHVIKGSEILKNFNSLDHIVEGALYHHERYDGKGYVQGLKGEEIPLFARIIGITDAFDAMTSSRIYRKRLEINDVMKELYEGRGTRFDPELLDIMIELINDGTIDIKKLYKEK